MPISSIDELRTLVGLTAQDERRIARAKPVLAQETERWAREYETWFRAATGWGERPDPPFLPDYLASFIGGQYGADFIAVQYRQGIVWRHQGINSAHRTAALSRLRQFFVGLCEVLQGGELARSLCRVVDVSQSIHATLTQLSYIRARLRKDAEQDIRRIRSSYEALMWGEDTGAIKAYTDHYQWKIWAYSLALGDPIASQQEVALSLQECALSCWLDTGGLEQVPTSSRPPLLAAHTRLHALMNRIFDEARQHRPHSIVQYLMEMEAASEEIAGVFERHIEQQMRQIAMLDALTKLGNRRMFEQDLARRRAQGHRKGLGFGLLFMDLDHFKLINDRYGHHIGDQVLRNVANSLRHTLRGSDAVYRWGGEEFVALVQAGDKGEVQAAAERLRSAVEQLPLDPDQHPSSTTISIGGTWFAPYSNTELDVLFARVDKNLHKAKAAGRNSSVLDE
jgi:diguanylate cyclase (GGDEF)-like protein